MRYLSFLLSFLLLWFSLAAKAETPVEKHGFLRVEGSSLVNQKGEAVQLKGMSSHGIQWYGKYVNYDAIKSLRDDWGLSVFRIAMYLNEGGYISNKNLKYKMMEAVDAAIYLGVYAIIDWHVLSERDPNVYRSQALEFFEEMANRYHQYPNVIYEIANEPNNTSWSGNIRPYAIALADKIRSIDKYNIIIVGTNNWSQNVDEAANNPLPAHHYNIMYTCHFYAASHGQYLRDKINYAMSKGIAVFVTEWGTTNYTGNGGIDLREAKAWTDFMAYKKISWANWSFSDHSESSAALVPGAPVSGSWTDAHLKASGRFVKSRMLE